MTDTSATAAALMRQVVAHERTLVTAESGPAGALARTRAATPGASRGLFGGFVVSTKAAKCEVVAISATLLAERTAVCRDIALAMAAGAFDIAVTGVTGPQSDDDGHPVGLVHFAVAAAAVAPHTNVWIRPAKRRIRWWRKPSVGRSRWLSSSICNRSLPRHADVDALADVFRHSAARSNRASRSRGTPRTSTKPPAAHPERGPPPRAVSLARGVGTCSRTCGPHLGPDNRTRWQPCRRRAVTLRDAPISPLPTGDAIGTGPFNRSEHHVNILGLVTKTHDTGVAILKDGLPTAIMEEERFNRDKHTQLFPTGALSAALATSDLRLQDIDVITTPWNVGQLRSTFRSIVTAELPASLNLLKPSAHSTQNSGIVFLRQRLKQGIRRGLGVPRVPNIVEVSHHDAHAAIFFVSPFDEAAVLVMDGYGDDAATSAYLGRGNRLERQWHAGFFDSLGALYTSVTTYLGFKPFEEGTVMALAACGGPTYRDRFRPIVQFLDDGRFKFNRDYVSFPTHGLLKPFTKKFLETFGPPRRPDEPVTDRHRDVAFALQSVTEDAVLHIVRSMRARTASKNLCISGGVALNCVANARILRDTDFERVWVPPCASDTGAPLGSTLFHWHQKLGQPRRMEMTHAFYGTAYSDDQIVEALRRAGLDYERLDDQTLFSRVAQDLAAKNVVGWFQGRFEMGPRALGNRSILSDPRDLAIKDILNARIKKREAFRPFAPAVLAERAAEYFEIEQPDPFMTLAPRVRPDKVPVIPAAVHVDGTGRIQTVDKIANPRFHAIISAFAEVTGVPVLLNTSFNRQEPVVASPDDAISCYLRTTMDVLVLGNFYIRDRNPEASAKAEANHKARVAHNAAERHILRQAFRP